MKLPGPKDIAGIQGKLTSAEKVTKKMEKTEDQEDLVKLNEEVIQIAEALKAEAKHFTKEFAEAVAASEAYSTRKATVKLEPDQVEYVHQLTGETLGFVEVDAPPPNETLPYTKDEITFFALQEAKNQADRRKAQKKVKQAEKEAAEAKREADEERKRILQELAERDPEAAAKLSSE